MNSNNLTIQEGTLSFWIKEDSIVFNDSKSTRIFQVDPDGGSILCVKDNDNKLKVFFVVIGKGRIDTEYNVSEIKSDKRHMVVFSWSLKQKELNLYFDGKLVAQNSINF